MNLSMSLSNKGVNNQEHGKEEAKIDINKPKNKLITLLKSIIQKFID